MIIIINIHIITVVEIKRNLVAASFVFSTLSLCLSITISVILSHKLLTSADSTNDNDTCSESIPEATPNPTKSKVVSVYDSDPEKVVDNNSSEERR